MIRNGRRTLLALALLASTAGPALAQPGGEGLPLDMRTRDGRQPGYAGNLARFGLGIQGAELATAVASGDEDRVDDALAMPTSPEFLVGLVTFDASLRVAGAGANRLPGNGAVSGYLKHNLALAGALTAASAVQIDLNGFGYGDALRGDFSKLEGASADLRELDLEEVGITVGAFALAQPLWNASKGIGRRFAGMVARRFARTAALKGALAVAPTGYTQVAAAGLTALDVVLAGADLAGLLLAAQAVDHTAGDAFREWRDSSRLRGAVEDLEGLAEQSQEATSRSILRFSRRPDPVSEEDFSEAMLAVEHAFADRRNDVYVGVAVEDLRLVRRLREAGADPAVLERIAGDALRDYGPELALPAQTLALLNEYEAQAAADPDGELAGLIERHRERVTERAAQAAQARALLYGQERSLLVGLRDDLRDARQRYLLQERIDLLDANIEIEAALIEELTGEALPPPPAPPAPPAQRSILRTGITQAINR